MCACLSACVGVCVCFRAHIDSYVVVRHTCKTTQDKQNNSKLTVYPDADVRRTHIHRQKKKNLDQEDRRRQGATVWASCCEGSRPLSDSVSVCLCAPGRAHTHTHTHIYTCINLHGLHDDGGGDSKAAGWRCGALMRGPNLIIIIYSLYLSWIYRCKYMLHLHFRVKCVRDDWGLMQIMWHAP